MLRAGAFRFRQEARLPVQPALKNRLQALIGTGLGCEGPLASRFQPRVGIGLGEAENAQTGAITHLRVGLVFQDSADDLGRRLPDAFPPMNQP